MLYQHLPEVNSYLIFGVEHKLVQNIEKWLGYPQFKHHAGALISNQSQYYVEPPLHSMFIDFNNQSFTQSVFNGKQLLHCNTFGFKNNDDIIYYSYYPLEQLGLMPNDIEVNLSGKIPNFDELVNIYQKYSQRVYELLPREVKNIGTTELRSLFRVILNIQCG